MELACEAMERARCLLAGKSVPARVAFDRDVIDVATELLTWNAGRRGELDRRLTDEPRFFERFWPLIDVHMRGLLAFDLLGEPRPAMFHSAPADVGAKAREFLADRRPRSKVADEADLESMWDEVSAG